MHNANSSPDIWVKVEFLYTIYIKKGAVKRPKKNGRRRSLF